MLGQEAVVFLLALRAVVLAEVVIVAVDADHRKILGLVVALLEDVLMGGRHECGSFGSGAA
jgi:hypothetical protein